MGRSAVHLVIVGTRAGASPSGCAPSPRPRGSGLSGWVRNRMDGTVRARAEGGTGGGGAPSSPGATRAAGRSGGGRSRVSAVPPTGLDRGFQMGDERVSYLCSVLGIRAGSKVSVVNPPPGLLCAAQPAPGRRGVPRSTAQTGRGRGAVLHPHRRGELLSDSRPLARSITPAGPHLGRLGGREQPSTRDLVRQAGWTSAS
jgi:hypothetical protein